jgi:hypothetical protein
MNNLTADASLPAMSWPKIVLILVIIAVTAVVVWRKRE